uniref:CFAP20 domain containing n=1 Tax=Poecilia formosa TaxID=48698 RepID=A0A096MB79_POEFO
MFKNNYQGGAVFDLFSGQGKDPVAKWKLCGGPSAIHKEYNKEVKGFVYCLEGSSHTVKMQMPKNAKMSLGLIQRFLIVQVNISERHDFSTELVITDLQHLKRRLCFSTVHKEMSATLLHAKIPFTELKRNTWSTLCIDLESFASGLFKGFLTLDGITLFATCKVRRIFTMKTDPKIIADTFLNGACLMEMIPRSFWYPSDVNQITHVLNYENLQKAEVKSDPLSSASAVPDQSSTAISTSYRRTKPQGVLQTAAGSRASSASPNTGRTSIANLDRMERSVCFIYITVIYLIPEHGANNTKYSAALLFLLNLVSRNGVQPTTHTFKMIQLLPSTVPFQKLQPHPPKQRVFGKQGSKKLRILSSGRERVSSGFSTSSKLLWCSPAHRWKVLNTFIYRGHLALCTLIPIFQTQYNQIIISHNVKTRNYSSKTATPTPVETQLRSGLSFDPEVWNSRESNEGSEPQLTLQKEVFTFSSQPHSPKRGQSQVDQEKMDLGDGQAQSTGGGRRQAQPEDDFIGSESDEEEFDRNILEVKGVSDDDEELQMLASLKRQQDEDECRAPALSASQVHQCDVSISLSSDDASTWTHISQIAVNQGHHYQKEMNPLLQSNP